MLPIRVSVLVISWISSGHVENLADGGRLLLYAPVAMFEIQGTQCSSAAIVPLVGTVVESHPHLDARRPERTLGSASCATIRKGSLRPHLPPGGCRICKRRVLVKVNGIYLGIDSLSSRFLKDQSACV